MSWGKGYALLTMSKRIHIYIHHRLAKVVRPFPYEQLLPYWSYAVPQYRFLRSRFPSWDGRKKLIIRDKLSASLFFATRKDIQNDLGVKFKVHGHIARPPKVWKKRQLVSSDRYYFQNDCLDVMLDKGHRYGGGLITNATGSGKTRIAAMYFGQIKGYGVFIVDQLDLLEQAKKEIEGHLGEKVGYVGKSKFIPRRITVATIQTLHAHRQDPKFTPWTDRIKAVFIDELHVQMNRSNFDVVVNIQPPVVFGLTATLQMSKKHVRLRAWSLCGPLIYSYPVKQGMAESVLSHGAVVRVVVPNNTRHG
jgi:superfamily II DNA or RNA helicase